MTLQIGDIVEISPDGEFAYQAEDSGWSQGEIMSIDKTDIHQYSVDFENGYSNCYSEDDLILIRNMSPNWKLRLGDEK